MSSGEIISNTVRFRLISQECGYGDSAKVVEIEINSKTLTIKVDC